MITYIRHLPTGDESYLRIVYHYLVNSVLNTV